MSFWTAPWMLPYCVQINGLSIINHQTIQDKIIMHWATITKSFYLAVYRCVLSDSVQLGQCYSFIKQIEIGNNLLCCYNAPLPLGKGKCATQNAAFHCSLWKECFHNSSEIKMCVCWINVRDRVVAIHYTIIEKMDKKKKQKTKTIAFTSK